MTIINCFLINKFCLEESKNFNYYKNRDLFFYKIKYLKKKNQIDLFKIQNHKKFFSLYSNTKFAK